MKIPYHSRPIALVATAALLSGCALTSSSDSEKPGIDVWLMRSSAHDSVIQAAVQEFEAAHPDVTVNVTIQEWGGIGEKVTEALTDGEGPDVIEVGNTQVAQYVETGGITNLTNQVMDLDGDDWIPGLAEPGKVYGHQYGVPYYAANRVVIYRTDLFEAAGISEPPTNRDDWLDATELLNEGDQQGIYLPGQNWYVLAGFIWDEGGDLAQEGGGQWRGSLDTDEARNGMEFYSQLQALGDGPLDADEADQDEVFATEDVAQMISPPGSAQTIVEMNPDLEDKLGYFPIPGKTDELPGAVFTGGSNLIIPKSTDESALAYEFVKLLTSDRWQTELAQTMSYVPNRTSLAHVVEDDPGAAAMVEGATKNGHSAPQSPRWGDVEANNPIKDYQTSVLKGADPEQAGREASDVLTELMSGHRPPEED